MACNASAGAGRFSCCTCMKRDTLSGQAWRGKHCALSVVFILFFQRLSAAL